ncbi:MAG: NAD(P)/FAD-dependent oxidoreductase, partial [Planctomycetota bacterium]
MPPLLDAIVIGAGPAGSCTALLLARLGWRAALIERGSRHRAKACGDCLNQRAERLLRKAGLLDEVRGLAAGRTRRLRVHVEGRPPLRAALPFSDGADRGLLVERPRFDQMLVDRAADAGAWIVQPASARVGPPGRGFSTVDVDDGRSQSRLRCRLVVGADGLRSSVARAHGLARRNGGRKMGFALDVRCPGAGVIRTDAIEMFVVAGGYLGVVNQGGGALHVAGLIAARSASPRSPRAFVESVAERFDVLRAAGLNRLDNTRCGPLLGAGP